MVGLAVGQATDVVGAAGPDLVPSVWRTLGALLIVLALPLIGIGLYLYARAMRTRGVLR